MREGCKKVRIKDIATVNPENITKKYPYDTIKYIDTSSVTDNVFEVPEILKLSDAPSRAKRILKKDDVIVSTVRPNHRHIGIIKKDDKNMVASTGFAVLRPNVKKIVPDYLYYVISLDKTTSYLSNIAESSTTAYPSIKPSVLAEMEIDLPPLPMQKKIAYILSTFDEKIELNRRMNRTLEAMAQAIFKSWFVDFDPVHAKAAAETEADLDAAAKRLGISREILDLFPDEFEESELGMIPKGWEVKPFSTIVELNTQSVKPFQQPDQLWEHYSIPAFDDGMIPVMEYGKEIKSNKYKVDKNAILASKLNPSTPRTWLPNITNPEYAICSTEFMQFVPKIDSHRPFVYELVISDYFQNEIKSCVTGTTGSRQRAQPKQVIQIPVILPTIEFIDKYNDIFKPLLIRILNNREEISTLQTSRNVLLPNLLAGEIDLSSLEG